VDVPDNEVVGPKVFRGNPPVEFFDDHRGNLTGHLGCRWGHTPSLPCVRLSVGRADAGRVEHPLGLVTDEEGRNVTVG
jgi:hypothetical protein